MFLPRLKLKDCGFGGYFGVRPVLTDVDNIAKLEIAAKVCHSYTSQSDRKRFITEHNCRAAIG